MRFTVLISGVAACLVFAGCNGQVGGTSTKGTHPSSGGSSGIAGSTGAAGAAGAAGTGGAASAGGATGSAGATGAGGATGTAGATGAGGSGVDGSVTTIDCTTTLPTGGNTFTGTNVNGKADGLNYGIWTNGSGGSITVFPSAHAFSSSWSNSSDFLAHLGLDFSAPKAYTTYKNITAEFAESKTGTAGGFSSIGIYGWTHSPCVEWYINEDSYNGLAPRGSVTAVIDGATYYLTTSTTNGTGGANACEAGHTGSWTNITSTRASAHQCGVVTVSDHFAAWAKQGWSVGSLASVHINVEVGGGTGTIQFPIANVTATSN